MRRSNRAASAHSGRAIREIATERADRQAPLFLNVHPNEFDESWLVQPDDPIFTHDQPIYLEVTESVPLSHFAYCHSVLREIRGKGVSLAVDDLGAGYSNLKYIVDLKPEIVKLDRTLIADLADDRRAQVLVRGTSSDSVPGTRSALVVAEGIEQETEMKVVIDCGAHFGQGLLLRSPRVPGARRECHASCHPQQRRLNVLRALERYGLKADVARPRDPDTSSTAVTLAVPPRCASSR